MVKLIGTFCKIISFLFITLEAGKKQKKKNLLNKYIFWTITVENYKIYIAQKMKFSIKGTLMQIWKSANIFVFIWK